jgi:hypothetical protein
MEASGRARKNLDCKTGNTPLLWQLMAEGLELRGLSQESITEKCPPSKFKFGFVVFVVGGCSCSL